MTSTSRPFGVLLVIAALASATLSMAAPESRPAQAADPKVVAAFRADCAAKAAAAEKAGTMTVAGRDGWFFFDGELRHLAAGPFWGEAAAKVSRAGRPEYADPLPAILDFKAQLVKAGVELILMPVPAKAAVYPDKVSDAVTAPPPRVDPNHQAFYDLLHRQGVKVIDLTPAFLAHRGERRPPVYCEQDTHWSGEGCVLAAKVVAAEVKRLRLSLLLLLLLLAGAVSKVVAAEEETA